MSIACRLAMKGEVVESTGLCSRVVLDWLESSEHKNVHVNMDNTSPNLFIFTLASEVIFKCII